MIVIEMCDIFFMFSLHCTCMCIINVILLPLKGLGNIVQMRDSGAKVVNSILDVQLKII